MKRIGLLIATTLFFIGCNNINGVGSSNSRWSSSQKKEFIEILNEDRYSSICDLTPMIEQYKKTKDEKVLTKILLGYTQNLANGCIDIDYFQSKLQEQKAKGINTHYEFYEEYVNEQDILNRLQKGESIENILATYEPQIPQFRKLIEAYDYTESPTLKHKIKINIERTKLLYPDGWDTYVLINVPEYKFRFFENGEKVLEFKVIVGKPTWQTPIFSSMLKYITVNPTWNVPDNIARKEIIPRIVKDINYLKRNNMVVKRDYGLDSPTINPKKVNWKEYLKPEWEDRELPYKIIELASSKNALGRV
ncbi:MAG: L,D-transpeptidase family protein, partial [Epsilonproteobacteria bacterium]|nr:L,D-transpeptidase family protein [Campylobacterota bacterium]